MRGVAIYWWRLAAAALVAVAEAYAQETQAPSRRIVVSIPDRQMVLIEDGRIVKTYPVAVGAPRSPSPVGLFRVATRVVNPAWYQPGKVVPPGPEKPLGPRWIGLDHKGYGIHGTNSPRSIGAAKSRGCIRMKNADVVELFERVAVGDVVELRQEPMAELQKKVLDSPEILLAER
ncbi:MAG: L,D-transpeptidase [Bryobacteraceae bacterium]|nr:L,D-transpeptidase [Bryobacteraceae bacterium]